MFFKDDRSIPVKKSSYWDLREGYDVRVRLFGESGFGSVDVYHFSDVLEELRFQARSSKEGRSCILMGGWYIDDAGRYYVEVEGFRDVMECSDSYVYKKHLLKSPIVLKEFRGERIVGCCHMRSGMGARAFEEDVLLHRSFFSNSYQVSLIIDGALDVLCHYSMDEFNEFQSMGFYVID